MHLPRLYNGRGNAQGVQASVFNANTKTWIAPSEAVDDLEQGKEKAARYAAAYLKRVANAELPVINWRESRARLAGAAEDQPGEKGRELLIGAPGRSDLAAGGFYRVGQERDGLSNRAARHVFDLVRADTHDRDPQLRGRGRYGIAEVVAVRGLNERMRRERVFERDLIHVRAANTTEPQHLFLRISGGDVVAHRAFGQ